MLSANKTLLLSALVFAVFCTYYHHTSDRLPLGAGPDNAAHNDVTRFISSYGRLPTIPRDEEALDFSPYGGTRALRPPLSYIVSAVLSKIHPFTELRPAIAYRKGPALLASLAVAIVFYTLFVYLESYGLALLGAVILGLLPQYVFVASYNNDDSGAIFSGSLLLLSMVLIVCRGVTLRNSILLGIAGGLVIVSKLTAWLLLPTLVLFLLLFIRAPMKKLVGYGLAAFFAAVLFGGWWILFNMYHYGSNDPFQQKIIKEVAERHTRFPADHVFGYKAKGIGFRDLVLENHDNFMEKTYKSTIGNLDWLRLRFGDLQYHFYLAVFFVAIGYVVLRFLWLMYAGIAEGFIWNMGSRRAVFELLLLFSLLFQFYMFVWANINNDIQVQGKYLLPVGSAVLILALSGLRFFGSGAMSLLKRVDVTEVSIGPAAIKAIGICSIALFAVGLHVYSWIHYVIPFYERPEYNLKLRPFRVVDLKQSQVLKSNDISHFEAKDGSLTVHALAGDPWLLLDRSLCQYLVGNNLMRIKIESDADEMFKIYWDDGKGFSETRQAHINYRKGYSELYFGMHVGVCEAVRMDPRRSGGTTKILEIASAPFAVNREDDWRKR